MDGRDGRPRRCERNAGRRGKRGWRDRDGRECRRRWKGRDRWLAQPRRVRWHRRRRRPRRHELRRWQLRSGRSLRHGRKAGMGGFLGSGGTSGGKAPQCNTLNMIGLPLTAVSHPEAASEMTGGTIVAGSYALAAVDLFGGASQSTERRETWRFGAGQVDIFAESHVAGEIGSQYSSSTLAISTSGATMTRAFLCPNESPLGESGTPRPRRDPDPLPTERGGYAHEAVRDRSRPRKTRAVEWLTLGGKLSRVCGVARPSTESGAVHNGRGDGRGLVTRGRLRGTLPRPFVQSAAWRRRARCAAGCRRPGATPSVEYRRRSFQRASKRPPASRRRQGK